MDTESNNQSYSSNDGFNTASIVEYRLRTHPLIEQVQQFLSGQKEAPVIDAEGNVSITTQQVGKRVCSEEGVQQITSLLQSFLNPHSIQGNLDQDKYERLMETIHKAIAYDLTINGRNWNIDPHAFKNITTNITTYASTIMTRPIDNEERISYGNTIRTTESNTVQQKSRGGIWKE